ncbi:glutamine amidotransferase [Lysobacter pythonis]|uniref:Glutamine amidotransferase n=1 Tax=Solilutibacter pythonis TaxID=2483112 RepID=A0A3M2I036_9GAMM|nr:glutamine amidotransferase [Lysobacter pythonis]RMH93755.1 glutamine amidotransferase [Lysobacter pythonis]
MSLPFLILQTGTPVVPMRRHGGFPHWIRVAAGLRGDEARVVDAESAEALPPPRGHAGILVTGSGAMVSHRRPWSESAADWLKRAADADVPVFGICYGHQLLAHALGGEVGDNPRGREMGTVEVRLRPAASRDCLFAGKPGRFSAHATHLQTVLAQPPGAEVLAETDLDGCAAFRVGGQAWGVQFHPEFSSRHMRGYIAARAPALREEGRSPAALHAAVRPAPVARGILRQFVRHAALRHR